MWLWIFYITFIINSIIILLLQNHYFCRKVENGNVLKEMFCFSVKTWKTVDLVSYSARHKKECVSDRLSKNEGFLFIFRSLKTNWTEIDNFPSNEVKLKWIFLLWYFYNKLIWFSNKTKFNLQMKQSTITSLEYRQSKND